MIPTNRFPKLATIFLAATLVAPAEQLPVTDVETLTGKKISIPAAFKGQPTLIILGFSKESQQQSKAWMARLGKDAPAYNTAVLEAAPRFVRGMIVRGIKNDVPQDLHDRFLLIFKNEASLKKAAQFEKANDAYVLVIDAQGDIRWRTHGPVTDDLAAQAKSQLR